MHGFFFHGNCHSMNDKCVVVFDVSQPLREVSNCNNNFVILFAFEHVRLAASHAATLPGKPALRAVRHRSTLSFGKRKRSKGFDSQQQQWWRKIRAAN